MKLVRKTKLNHRFTKYDIETTPHHNFIANGIVVHNSNARYVYINDQMFCGSHTGWKKENEKSIWWQAYANHREINDFCIANPGMILYGEVYGQVQDLKYGVTSGVRLVAFDILKGNEWLSYADFLHMCTTYKIPKVPTLYVGPYSYSLIEELAEGKSILAKEAHVREGCVVKPVIERTDPCIGRVILKMVGNGYYARK